MNCKNNLETLSRKIWLQHYNNLIRREAFILFSEIKVHFFFFTIIYTLQRVNIRYLFIYKFDKMKNRMQW